MKRLLVYGIAGGLLELAWWVFTREPVWCSMNARPRPSLAYSEPWTGGGDVL